MSVDPSSEPLPKVPVEPSWLQKASSTSLASSADRRFLAFRIVIARGCRSCSGMLSISRMRSAVIGRLLGTELCPDRRGDPGSGLELALTERHRVGDYQKGRYRLPYVLQPGRWWHRVARRGRPHLRSPPSQTAHSAGRRSSRTHWRGADVSDSWQTGQSEEIHSPEVWSKRVVRLTVPMARSMSVV